MARSGASNFARAFASVALALASAGGSAADWRYSVRTQNR
jgi:hypothetical protein